MLMTTPLRRPRDGWMPMPITSMSPPSAASARRDDGPAAVVGQARRGQARRREPLAPPGVEELQRGEDAELRLLPSPLPVLAKESGDQRQVDEVARRRLLEQLALAVEEV